MGLILPILMMAGKRPVEIRLLYCTESTGLRMCEAFLGFNNTDEEITDFAILQLRNDMRYFTLSAVC